MPEFAGYTHTPAQTTIAAQVVEPTTNNVRIEIYYAPISNPTNPTNTTDPTNPTDPSKPDKPNGPDKSKDDKANKPGHAGQNNTKPGQSTASRQDNDSAQQQGNEQAAKQQTAAHNGQKAERLPQTGNQGFFAKLLHP